MRLSTCGASEPRKRENLNFFPKMSAFALQLKSRFLFGNYIKWIGFKINKTSTKDVQYNYNIDINYNFVW